MIEGGHIGAKGLSCTEHLRQDSLNHGLVQRSATVPTPWNFAPCLLLPSSDRFEEPPIILNVQLAIAVAVVVVIGGVGVAVEGGSGSGRGRRRGLAQSAWAACEESTDT